MLPVHVASLYDFHKAQTISSVKYSPLPFSDTLVSYGSRLVVERPVLPVSLLIAHLKETDSSHPKLIKPIFRCLGSQGVPAIREVLHPPVLG